MLDVAFVILRELSELLLILLAVGKCLENAARPDLRRAAVVAAFVGCAVGWGVMSVAVSGPHGPRIEAVAGVLLGIAILWMANAMLFSDQAIRARVEDALASLLGGPRALFAVVACCGLAGMRESMEVFVFLRSAAADHAPADVVRGAAIGIATVAAVCLAFRSLWGKLRLLAIYRVSTLLLFFLSVRLIIGGLSSLAGDLAAAHPGSSMPSLLLDHAHATRLAWLATLWPTLVFLRRWWRESRRPA